MVKMKPKETKKGWDKNHVTYDKNRTISVYIYDLIPFTYFYNHI